MSVGHRPTNLRAGDAREQLTRILEPLDPGAVHRGRNHQQQMAEIDEPDEPQIFSDGGPRVEHDALTAEELDRHTDEETTLLEDRR
jgi:hypothetical protein